MISRKYIYFFVSVLIFFAILRLSFDFPVSLWEDHDIAVNLVNEGEFYYESDGARNHTFQFPVYPSTVAFVYSLFGVKPLLACLLNVLVHVFSGVIFYSLFHLLLGFFNPGMKPETKKRIVFISLLIFLFHPVLLIYSFYHVHPLTFNILSLFSGLYFSLRAVLNPSGRNLFMAGLIIGISMLDRATVVLTLLPSGIILWQRVGFIGAFKKLFFICLISLLIISPWLIRNYRADGIIGFESSASKNIWKGVLYNSDGSNYLMNGENYYSVLGEDEKDSLGTMSPIEQRDFFNSKYEEIWKKDPAHVVKMFFVKWKNFWWFRSAAGAEWGKWKNILPLYKAVYGVTLLLIIYFLYRNFRKGMIILSFPIALSILQAYFYVETRHRIAIEPLLCFLAIISFFILHEDFLNQRKKVNHG